ncbi:g2516 [Coccomyxa elongata]
MTRHGGGGVRPIGMKKYPDARQAAVAYDEHVFREHGYDAVLNFDADNYRDLEERDRAETQAIQKERARRWHLVCLQKQGIITEDEMRSWIRSPLDN